MKTFAMEEKVPRMTPEEKRAFLMGKVLGAAVMQVTKGSFKNTQGMTSTITNAGRPKTASTLVEGSKAK